MNARIMGIGAYAPKKRMLNDELAQFVETSDEWIYSHTGIRCRHIAADEEAASDLAVEACKDLFSNIQKNDPNFDPQSIDLILLATSTPDYPGLPSTACVVQDRLAIENAGAMDLVAACTGFIYGLETAAAYIKSEKATRVLVVGTEVYSKIVNWKDRTTCVLFGDGAGAVLVEASKEGQGDINTGKLNSKGSGVEHLLRPAGGTRKQFVPGTTAEEELYLYMNGRQVYIFAVGAIIDTVDQLLELNGLSIDDIDHFVPHQANKRIIEAACKRRGLPMEKFFMNIEEYANTSAASIPLALKDMEKAGVLKRGQRIMTLGFGSGLTFGGNVFVY